MKVPTPPSPTPPAAAPLTGSPSADELRAALSDERVAQAFHLVLRDVRIRSSFEALRAQGLAVERAVERLLGPHRDASGRPYYLSEERVRTIVYRRS